MTWRPRVVVCGTGFGRTYLAALRQPGMPFELAGILAAGSQRSRDCARHYQVPMYTDADQIPAGTDIACVAVNAAQNGGRGAELAQDLMARGLHVLQEHPLLEDELAGCLRRARRHGVVYHLNTNYVHVGSVACFIEAARRLLACQPAVFIDVLTSFQVLYALADILGQALGSVRPWSLACRERSGPVAGAGLRGVDGVLGGVPAAMLIQNQIDLRTRDNGPHVMHRVTLVTEGGDLLLANTQGPVVWSPRLHMPADYVGAVTLASSAAAHLDLPSATCLMAPGSRSHREVISEDWTAAACRALLDLRRAIEAGEDPLPRGQYHLGLCRLVAEITAGIGRPDPTWAGDPPIVAADAAVRGEPAPVPPPSPASNPAG